MIHFQYRPGSPDTPPALRDDASFIMSLQYKAALRIRVMTDLDRDWTYRVAVVFFLRHPFLKYFVMGEPEGWQGAISGERYADVEEALAKEFVSLDNLELHKKDRKILQRVMDNFYKADAAPKDGIVTLSTMHSLCTPNTGGKASVDGGSAWESNHSASA